MLRAKLAKRGDIKAEMVRAIRVKVPRSQQKKPRGGPEPAPIFRMRWPQELLLQMNERARSLDEAFIISVIFVAALKPEMLEHVMRFVIALLVEALKKAGVARVERRVRRAELLHECRHAIRFFHRRLSRPTNRKLQIANRKR